MKFAIICLFAASALLVACSDEKPPPLDQPRTPAQQTVFDTQLKALDKAKAMQKTIDQQKAAADKKLEDAGG